MECWDNEYSKTRGFSSNPENDILNELKNFNYVKLEDYIDKTEGDKNIIIKVN